MPSAQYQTILELNTLPRVFFMFLQASNIFCKFFHLAKFGKFSRGRIVRKKNVFVSHTTSLRGPDLARGRGLPTTALDCRVQLKKIAHSFT